MRDDAPRRQPRTEAVITMPDDDVPLVRFARPVHAPGLELVHYSNLTRGWRGIPEAYTWFTMIDSLQGDVDVISRGIRAQCEPGSVTVGEPGEPYALRPHSAMRGEFRVVRIYNDLLDEIVEAIGTGHRASPFPCAPVCDPMHSAAFARLYRAADIGETLETEERLLVFVRGLARRDRVPDPRAGWSDVRAVRRARDLLHARFDTSVSLDELAGSAGMDKFALLRAFSRQLGITPHAYQVQVRLAHACQLIGQGMPLAHVAGAVGYSEQSALNRRFRRLVGVTPGEYARSVR